MEVEFKKAEEGLEAKDRSNCNYDYYSFDGIIIINGITTSFVQIVLLLFLSTSE